MDFFTVVLLTGALNGQGEVQNIQKQVTQHQFNTLKSCQKLGSTLAARRSNEIFASMGQLKRRKYQSSQQNGRFVGYFCQTSNTSSTNTTTPIKHKKTGITLYSGYNFSGRWEILSQEDNYLADNSIGNNNLSSILIPKGCSATLYDQPHYRGQSMTLYQDTLDLSQTILGDNRTSSIKMHCGNSMPTPQFYSMKPKQKVEFYSDVDFKGRSQSFTENQAYLGGTTIDRNTIRSLKIDQNCEVTLYSKGNYQGRKSVFYQDKASLYGTVIGDNSADSFTFKCH